MRDDAFTRLPLTRTLCTCRRERRVGTLTSGWTLPPPCPACAAWDAGFVLVNGERIRREVWLGRQTSYEEQDDG